MEGDKLCQMQSFTMGKKLNYQTEIKILSQRWKKRGWTNEKGKRNSDRYDADPGGSLSYDGKACNITEASGFHSAVYIVFRVYGNTRYYEKKYI